VTVSSFANVADAAKVKRSPTLKVSNIKVTNNKDKPDIVEIKSLKSKDIVKIYSSSNKLLYKSSAVKKSSLTISLKQLGQKSGFIFVTVTKRGMSEGKKVKVTFKGEEVVPLLDIPKSTNNSIITIQGTVNEKKYLYFYVYVEKEGTDGNQYYVTGDYEIVNGVINKNVYLPAGYGKYEISVFCADKEGNYYDYFTTISQNNDKRDLSFLHPSAGI